MVQRSICWWQWAGNGSCQYWVGGSGSSLGTMRLAGALVPVCWSMGTKPAGWDRPCKGISTGTGPRRETGWVGDELCVTHWLLDRSVTAILSSPRKGNGCRSYVSWICVNVYGSHLHSRSGNYQSLKFGNESEHVMTVFLDQSPPLLSLRNRLAV